MHYLNQLHLKTFQVFAVAVAVSSLLYMYWNHIMVIFYNLIYLYDQQIQCISHWFILNLLKCVFHNKVDPQGLVYNMLLDAGEGWAGIWRANFINEIAFYSIVIHLSSVI